MSSITYTASAGQTDYQVPFEFLSEAHLTVTLDGAVETNWTLVNGNTVRFGGAVVVVEGATVEIERSTPIDEPLVEFQTVDSIRKRELDKMSKQLLFALQELEVQAAVGLRKNGAGTAWEAESLPIRSVASPSSATDAATKGYVDTAVAGDGILPTPVEADIGRGIRIRSGGGSPTYQIGSVSGAVAAFKVPAQPSLPDGSALGFGVENVNYGYPQWLSRDETRVPLELETSFLEPEGGALEVAVNGFDIPIPRGSFEIMVFGQVRSLTSKTTAGILFAEVALTTASGTLLDKSPLLTLGAGGGATDPPAFPGQPSFPYSGTAYPLLYAVFSPTVATSINIRAYADSAAGEVVLDVPFRLVIREIPQ